MATDPMVSKAQKRNPIAFTPWPVTVITTIVYLALIIPLLYIYTVVPSPPGATPTGINITEAWADLQHLTRGFHPYNSRKNDEVRVWLLERIKSITSRKGDDAPDVFVFDDNTSNLTFSGTSLRSRDGVVESVYFEGTNILVYVRGSDDDEDNWWEDPTREPPTKGGVLVNAHYDSVSTGYGATDDGVGVISLLQLISYYVVPENAPRKGIVFLFNNGEEDYLNGARVYSQHPLSKFPHTFLNLEGAGAGGRATLFRTTDTEVARFYKKSPHPYGTVISADGFERGLIRSQTDYVVFDGSLGLRGLDVAFYQPRSRYHTKHDDTRHTSVNSVWHMLSAAIATTEGLASDTSDQFDGEPRGLGKVPSGTGTRGVWFDMFGSSFAVFRLHTLFAISVTLLIVAPLVILTTIIILSKSDKLYPFSVSKRLEDGGEKVSLLGLRGLFRFPVSFVVTSAATIALAFLLTKVNPYIVHSSEYAVWAMMISAWVFVSWFLACIADFARPSALTRVYGFTWLFFVSWILLVIVTSYENRLGVAGGYFIFFYCAAVFVATWISYLELFALPRKSEYASQAGGGIGSTRPSSHGSQRHTPSSSQILRTDDEEGEEEDPTESTSLLRDQRRTTFANYTRPNDDDSATEEGNESRRASVYGDEQAWSASLPTWTWLLQLLLVAPIIIIMVGQVGLLLTTSMHQTGPDGSSLFLVYLGMALVTILLLLPTSAFIHRFSYHIPLFLFLVFVGTLIYCLSAFPFSSESRLKVSFIQDVDVHTGANRVSLVGVPPFLEDVIHAVPSAAGQELECKTIGPGERTRCSWTGPSPSVAGESNTTWSAAAPKLDWISVNTTRARGGNKARIEVSARNSRACRLLFDSTVSNFVVVGSAHDDRFPHIAPQGTRDVRLWSRTWDSVWVVDVEWDDEQTADLTGQALCLWSDHNQAGTIPALDEVLHYVPVWAIVTKFDDGLVQGRLNWTV